MRPMRYVLSALLVSSFNMSCAHQSAAKNVQKVPQPDKVDSEVPQELWSPERKKSNASFYYLAGEHELMAHNAESAAKLFDTAYSLEPNAFVASKLVEAKSIINVDEGLELAKKMSLLYPKNSEIQLTYGRLLAAKGDLKGAEGYLKNAVKLRPENLESSVLLIQLLQAQNRTKEAIEVAKQMVERSGDFIEGWALLARLYLANNQPTQAAAAARKAFDLNTNDPEKMHLLAVSLLLSKQTKEALSYFDQLLRPENFSDDTIEKMVKFYDDLNMPKHYLEIFQKAEKDSGKKSDGLSFQMAVLQWGKKNFQDSSQILESLAKSHPQNDKLKYLLGLTRENNGQIEEALNIYRSFNVDSELYAVVRVRAFEVLKKLGRNDEALKVSQEAIDAKSEQSAMFYSLSSNLLSSLDRNTEALALVEKGLADDPSNVELLFLKAVFLEKSKKIDECVAVLQQIIKKDPKHAAALNYLGYMWAERGIRLDEAEGLIKRALDEKPENGYYMDSLGWVYYQQKRYKEAVVTLERAFQLSNNDPTIAEHLGDAYVAAGDGQKARAAYQITIESLKDKKDVERVKAKYEMSKSAD